MSYHLIDKPGNTGKDPKLIVQCCIKEYVENNSAPILQLYVFRWISVFRQSPTKVLLKLRGLHVGVQEFPYAYLTAGLGPTVAK